jgi:hypothetical protein
MPDRIRTNADVQRIAAGRPRLFNGDMKTSIVALALTFSQLATAGGDLYPTAECMQQLKHDWRLQSLEHKVALGLVDEATPAMLALERRPTAEESSALGLWLELRQGCYAVGAAHREAAHTALPLLAGRMFGVQQRLVGELRDGRTSFGEFNRRRLEASQVERRQQAALLRTDKLPSTTAALR